MNQKILFAMSVVLCSASSLALAADAKVTITSPANGATVKAAEKMKLTYEAVPGPDGDHLHLYVDGKRVDVIRELKGTTEVALSPGSHHVCMQVNTKGHSPVGSETCIDVSAK